MAGLLTFPVLIAFPSACRQKVADLIKTRFGITAAGTVQEFSLIESPDSLFTRYKGSYTWNHNMNKCKHLFLLLILKE